MISFSELKKGRDIIVVGISEKGVKLQTIAFEEEGPDRVEKAKLFLQRVFEYGAFER